MYRGGTSGQDNDLAAKADRFGNVVCDQDRRLMLFFNDVSDIICGI